MPFYVTQIRDNKFRRVSQPFIDKEAAEKQVEPARKYVCSVDPWSDFDAFGVTFFAENNP